MVKGGVLLVLVAFSVIGKAQTADSAWVFKHLSRIISTDKPRNFKNINALNNVAGYIKTVFENYADSTHNQEFKVGNSTFKNVIASFGTEHENRIVVGAHYDVCGEQDGADDNASGVVGLLELARLLKGVELNKRIDLVAYSLEEPPFFRSENMGSYVHAKWLHENNIPVEGMICLEMIGYFDETKGSQHYPVGALKLIYGSRGDFITVVRKLNSGSFARKFKRKMKRKKAIDVKSFQGPESLPGIDFSDHLNYWHFGYSAVMITNTAFYRNKNYHNGTDELKTLDIPKMTAVIQSVYLTLLDLAAVN